MTAIGAWRWQGLPVLVGDVALSGLETGPPAVVPTIKSVESRFPKGSGYVVSGVVQKVVLLSDSLAVAWAGSFVAAIEALGVLRSVGSPSIDRLKQSLEEMDDCVSTRDLVLLGWVRHGNDWSQFSFRDLRFETIDNAGGMFAGTGADALSEAQTWASRAPVIGDTDPRLICACRCVCMMGHLIRHELSFNKSLLHYFGGGYEAVCVRDDRLQKLDVAAQIFWDAEFVEAALRVRPLRVLRNSYDGEYLVVRAADLEFANAPGEARLVDEDVHVVGAPGSTELDPVTAREVVVPRFAAPLTSSHTLLRRDGIVHCIVNNLSTSSELLETDDGRLLIPDRLCEAIAEAVNASGLVGSA